MAGCVLSQLKHSELYILSCGKGLGLPPLPFPQLRMLRSSGFILYEILYNNVQWLEVEYLPTPLFIPATIFFWFCYICICFFYVS